MAKSKKRPELTQAQVRRLFAYNDEGFFTWRVALNKATKIGDRAGTVSANDKGYMRVKIRGWEYAVHRLVYLWHTGESPPMVDHADHDRQNNRIENLRAASASDNSRNATLRSDAKLKVKGVTYRQDKNKPYIAELRVNGKRVMHVSFFTLEEAERAVMEARRVYHGSFHCDG
jgi:hypothetical protein